jgi:hypothetical protein
MALFFFHFQAALRLFQLKSFAVQRNLRFQLGFLMLLRLFF